MQTRKTVYLDHAASSPLRQQARDALLAYEQAPYTGANPNSLHPMGRQAARALDGARAELARCLGGRIRPADVTFTSGGTESTPLAVLGMAEGMRSRDRRRTCVVLSAIEHDSILDLVPMLHERGFEVRLAKCDRSGVVTPELLGEVLDASCALVSVMSANNETGVVQPVGQLARTAHAAGALFHTDAVQAFGRIPLDLADVDAVSVAAHKIGGPVGIGALAVRGRVPLRPMMLGGGQELGRRPGTQDVSSALAFAAAATWCCANLEQNRIATAGLARGLYARLCMDSETLILALDQHGFEVSAGSACSSGSLDPSHVLSAMGIPRNDALGSLRISFDERCPREDLDAFADALLAIVAAGRAR